MFGIDDAIIAAGVSAGGKLLGGLFGRDESKRAAEIQRENQLRQEALQREFAQNSISWKVEDAKRAGLHPLAALGAASTSYAPVSVGTPVDHSMSEAFAGAGQDLSRAINATRTTEQRELAFKQSALQLEGMQLDNDIKRASLASQVQKIKANENPPMPSLTSGPVPVDKEDAAAPMHLRKDDRMWHDPNVSNANVFENRYGEISDWAMGPYVLWQDLKYNLRNNPNFMRAPRPRYDVAPWRREGSGGPLRHYNFGRR